MILKQCSQLFLNNKTCTFAPFGNKGDKLIIPGFDVFIFVTNCSISLLKAAKKLQLVTKQNNLLKIYWDLSGPSIISSASQANKYYFSPFYPLHKIIIKVSFIAIFPVLLPTRGLLGPGDKFSISLMAFSV